MCRTSKTCFQYDFKLQSYYPMAHRCKKRQQLAILALKKMNIPMNMRFFCRQPFLACSRLRNICAFHCQSPPTQTLIRYMASLSSSPACLISRGSAEERVSFGSPGEGLRLQFFQPHASRSCSTVNVVATRSQYQDHGRQLQPCI